MNASFLCMYCGKKWEGTYFSYIKPKCSICGDKNIKIKSLEKESKNCYGYPEEDKDDSPPTLNFDDSFLGGEDS